MPEYHGAEISPNKELISSELQLIRSNDPKDELGRGAEGPVTRVKIVREGREEVMALKETNGQISSLQSNLIVRDILINAGIPTYESFTLLIEDGKDVGILMEDLTDNGRNFILSSNEMKLIHFKIQNLLRTTPQIIKTISEILDATIESFYKEFDKYTKASAKAKLKFTLSDCIFWVITPEGKVSAIIGDLGTVQYKNDLNDEELENHNRHVFQTAIEELTRLREICREKLSANSALPV